MGVPLHFGLGEWARLFAGRESEFKDRLIRVSPEEKQTIRILHPDPENILTSHIHQQKNVRLGPSEVLILEDVLFDNRNGSLILPFMQEYEALSRQVDREISTPHNSGLCFWLAYGHLLQDQLSNEGIYQLHPATRGLPMAFNFYNVPSMIQLVETQWKRPHLVLRENITRFKKLHLLIRQPHEIKQAQSVFMQKEFGVSGPKGWKDFFLSSPPARRIYLARTQTRKVVNDAELDSFLKARGFEKWSDSQLAAMTIREQAALFHSAGVLVSPHGSQLINSLFCHPDVILVELFKFSWIEWSPFSALRSVSSRAQYAYLIDWQPWESAEQSLRHADMRVDLSKLEKLLEKLSVH